MPVICQQAVDKAVNKSGFRAAKSGAQVTSGLSWDMGIADLQWGNM